MSDKPSRPDIWDDSPEAGAYRRDELAAAEGAYRRTPDGPA